MSRFLSFCMLSVGLGFGIVLHAQDYEAINDSKKPDVTGAIVKPSVFFIEPANGATVKRKFKVKFGVKGMEVKPAGEVAVGSGHHHLIINGDFVPEKQIVPANDRSIHFGKGQTETELDLKPGKYKLTLQFADGAHASYGQALSSTIEVTVTK